ncbi:MAG: hypothetical protein KKC18_15440 [Chloroflexi bacterium]|nr:hypothetical protein [Chloroflexota bacterium]
MKRIIAVSVAVGALGVCVWCSLLMLLQDAFYTILGIDTVILTALVTAIVGAIVSYIIGRWVVRDSGSELATFTRVAIGAIVSIAAYFLCLILLLSTGFPGM